MRHSRRLAVLTVLLTVIAVPAFGVTRVVDRNNVACSDDTGNPYCTIEAAVDDAVDGDVIDVQSGTAGYTEFVLIDDEDLTVTSTDTPVPTLDPPSDWAAFVAMPTRNWCTNPSTVLPPRVRPAETRPTVVFENFEVLGADSMGLSAPFFNGDDAIVLRKDTNEDGVYETIVDVIGVVGTDPGNEWGSGATSTNRANLIRKADNCTRDTTPTSGFNPSDAYTGTALHHTFATVDAGTPPAVTDLGTHTSSCTPSDLLFSQYVESYQFRNAIEIWNGTGSTINLNTTNSRYLVEIYQNGSDCPWQVIPMSGTITTGTALYKSASLGGLGSTFFSTNHPQREQEDTSFDFYGAVGNDDSILTVNNVDISGAGDSAVISERATTTINDSNLHDNGGYGVWHEYGTTTVNDSTVQDNDDSGIYTNNGTFNLNASLVEASGNEGFEVEGTALNITDSTIRDNDGSGIWSDNGQIAINGSTIELNNGWEGGGIYQEHLGPLDITNSTISGNAASTGGGIYALGLVTLEHVTLYNNNATSDQGDQIYLEDSGYDDSGPYTGGPNSPIPFPDEDLDDESGSDYPRGGVRWCYPNCYQGLGELRFRNTVIAGGTDPCYAEEDNGFMAVFTSQGNNLVYPSDADCGADEPTDINGVDPQLMALADNGGPTQTHAFDYSSPLFDAGVETETEDQRGEPRPQGTTSDIGAFELDAPTVRGVKSVTGTFTPGGNITYTIVLTNEGNVDQQDNPGDELVDNVPTEVTVTGGNATSGTLDITGNTVTWNGAIAAGDSVTITINATINPNATGSVENQAMINYDPDNSGDNDETIGTGSPGGPGPTIINLGALAAEIPTISPLAMALLAFAIGLAALVALRARG